MEEFSNKEIDNFHKYYEAGTEEDSYWHELFREKDNIIEQYTEENIKWEITNNIKEYFSNPDKYNLKEITPKEADGMINCIFDRHYENGHTHYSEYIDDNGIKHTDFIYGDYRSIDGVVEDNEKSDE